MDTRLDPRGSRVPACVVVDIIDGRPWVASRIRNNNTRQHLRILGRAFYQPHPCHAVMREPGRRLFAIVAQRSTLLTAVHPSALQVVPLLLRLTRFCNRWQKQPEKWQPDPELTPQDQWRSLVDTLLSYGFPLPEFFGRVWVTPGRISDVERFWYCYAVAGYSLRKVKTFPSSVSRRALHLAMQAPEPTSIQHALRWGQVKSLGGSDALVAEVLTSRMAIDFANDEVWLPLLEKFIASGKGDGRGFGPVADMLAHELKSEGLTETSRLMCAPLRELKRRAHRLWKSLFATSRQHGARIRSKGIYSPGIRLALSNFVRRKWDCMPDSVSREVFTVHGQQWQVDQLTSYLQLSTEGSTMKHCVGSYWRECTSGDSAIFSFREIVAPSRAPVPRITIEVDIDDRELVQLRRKSNERIDPSKLPIVRRWAARNRVKIDC